MEPLGAADPTQVGEFRLLATLGAGGMGQVFLAASLAGRLVAVKVIHPELARDQKFAARFRSEVAAASRVSGLYTAPVVAAGVDEKPMWLATAFVPGPSLDEMVYGRDPLPLPAVWRLAAGVAEALRAIHSAGLVHRDLKPGNVMLALDGPRVIDFGISRSLSDARLTASGTVMGTPAFMSPEQVEGEPAGPSADVFSLGAVVAFAASGMSPFGATGASPAAVLYRVARAEPDLSELPGQLRGLVTACLARDPRQRPSLVDVAAAGAQATADLGLSLGAFWPSGTASIIEEQLKLQAAEIQALQADGSGKHAAPSRPPGPPSGRGPDPFGPAHSAPARTATDTVNLLGGAVPAVHGDAPAHAGAAAAAGAPMDPVSAPDLAAPSPAPGAREFAAPPSAPAAPLGFAAVSSPPAPLGLSPSVPAAPPVSPWPLPRSPAPPGGPAQPGSSALQPGQQPWSPWTPAGGSAFAPPLIPGGQPPGGQVPGGQQPGGQYPGSEPGAGPGQQGPGGPAAGNGGRAAAPGTSRRGFIIGASLAGVAALGGLGGWKLVSRHSPAPPQGQTRPAHGLTPAAGTTGGASTPAQAAVPAPKPAWRFETGNTVEGSPSVAGGVAYVGSSDGFLYAVSIGTGKLAWKSHVVDNLTIAPTVAAGVVGSAGAPWGISADTVDFYAVSAGSGTNLWNMPLGSADPMSTPSWAISGSAIIVTQHSDDESSQALLAVDAKTGALSRTYTTANGFSGAIAVDGDIIYALDNGGTVLAISVTSGITQWQEQVLQEGSGGGLLAVAGGSVFVAADGGKLFSLNANTGGFNYAQDVDDELNSAPVVVGGVMYIVGENALLALRASDASRLWTGPAGGLISPPAVAGGQVYVSSGDQVYALDARTGKPVWSLQVSQLAGGTPAVSSGLVFVGSGNDLYAIRP